MSHPTIKIFKPGDMKTSPFNEKRPIYNKLLEHGIVFVEDYPTCDICVVKTMQELKLTIEKYGNKKKYLLWNNEPCQDKNFISKIRVKNATVHIMNAYTGDIWFRQIKK